MPDSWEDAAARVSWDRRWEAVHSPGPRGGAWFQGARLNVAANCLDRHLPALEERVAFHWEGEPGDRRSLTYGGLAGDVARFAAALRSLGVQPGDRVALYMGLVPETVIAMLACARLGAVHAVLAQALPAEALADRLVDLGPRVLVTQDGSWRHGVVLPLKARADEAMAAAAGVEHTIVVRRTGIDVAWYEGDVWYDEVLGEPDAEPPLARESDEPLCVVYIANRRGRPTGIVHRSGSFLVYAAAAHENAFSTAEDDVLWIAADVAWVAVQSHAVYGSLACGATGVLYEGMLDTPTHARTWELVGRYGVTVLATTPSVVRTLRRRAAASQRGHELGSLRALVTAGEAIEPELRDWLRLQVAPRGAVVADAWGQTELGGIVTVSEQLRQDRALPDPGLDVVGGDGRPMRPGDVGEVVLRKPWAGTMLGVENDDGSAAARYWRPDGSYATGDRALRDAGSLVFLGRIDPVVSISAQLVSLTEVREALLEHPFVADAEIVEREDRETGQALAACVVLTDRTATGDDLARALRAHVHERLGGLAEPRTVAFVEAFPDDVPAHVLRDGLRMLCASDQSVTLAITAAQIRAASASVA
jgi:acetyl-CoA synthetase